MSFYSFKQACVIPTIIKATLTHIVSLLLLASKILKCSLFYIITNFLHTHNLLDPLKSSLWLAQPTVTSILDQSSAIDNTDHSLLMHHGQYQYMHMLQAYMKVLRGSPPWIVIHAMFLCLLVNLSVETLPQIVLALTYGSPGIDSK